MTLSTDQLTDRSAGLSATDIPAILGLHPFRSAMDVWLEKTGKAQPFIESDRVKWGNLLEPIIRADYATRNGYEVQEPGTKIQEYAGVLFAATPDGIVPHVCGLEIKTHSHFAADYGPEGTDQVPHHIAMQCQIGAALFDLPYWDVVAFWDGIPHDFRVVHNSDITRGAFDFAAAWWRKHVVAHVAPYPDGSDATSRAIAKFLPGAWRDLKQAEIIEATPDQIDRIYQLKIARQELECLELDMAIRKQALQLEIGDADGLLWLEDGKKQQLTWRRTRDSVSTDYGAALIDYQNQLMLRRDDLPMLLDVIDRGPDLKTFTTEKPGHRRFVVPRSWGKSNVENE